jgi:hypothetical protein
VRSSDASACPSTETTTNLPTVAGEATTASCGNTSSVSVFITSSHAVQHRQPTNGFSASSLSLDGGNNGGAGSPPREDGGHGDNGGNPSHSWHGVFTFLLRGIQGRLQADPFFAHKLAVECGLDAAIIIGVNFAARRERFFPELEFTLCQLAISLLSDFALVYLLAPTAMAPAVAGSKFRRYLAALPAHFFQGAPVGAAPFALSSRFATLALKAVQYGGVGFIMGTLGASLVQSLIALREKVDGSFQPPGTVQSVGGTGAAWCTFMATSSNVRYNAVNALEDVLYSRGARAGKLGSVALRLLNNWAGAAQWVMVTETMKLHVPYAPHQRQEKGKKRPGLRREIR